MPEVMPPLRLVLDSVVAGTSTWGCDQRGGRDDHVGVRSAWWQGTPRGGAINVGCDQRGGAISVGGILRVRHVTDLKDILA